MKIKIISRLSMTLKRDIIFMICANPALDRISSIPSIQISTPLLTSAECIVWFLVITASSQSAFPLLFIIALSMTWLLSLPFLTVAAIQVGQGNG